jgi:hypothetical protein
MGINVVKGQSVKAGDLLSKGGFIRPQDVLAATNSIARVQDQMINDLSHEFTNAKVRVRRKIFETAIQPFTNRAVVEEAGDAGKEFGIHIGDTLSVNNIQAMNKKLKADKKRQITFTPVLLSLRAAPHYSEDFIGQLISERPHETLKRAPALGYVSDIGPSGHPVATYAFGRYFGTKVNENVKKVAQDVVGDLDAMIESTTPVIEVDEDFSDMGKLMSDLRILCESGPIHRLRN